jgi:hypothetical protein
MEVRTLAQSARALILRVLPSVEETVDASASRIGYGYGTGYKGAVCTLLLSKSGLKIGVAYGASLADPQHLLTGSGKVHRFVQVSETGDLEKPGLAKLLKAANEAARARLK